MGKVIERPRRWTGLIIFTVIWASGLSRTQPHAASLHQLPKIQIALPPKIDVVVRWILPPIDAGRIAETHWEHVRFTVDGEGQPWFGHDQRFVVNPLRGLQIKLTTPYQDIAFLDDGAFLVSTEDDLGLIPKPRKPGGEEYYLTAFQPVTELPAKNARLFPGGDGTLYIAGYNGKTEDYELYLLSRSSGDSAGLMERKFKKLLSIKRPISAVAGDGRTTYVAVGPLILELESPAKDAKGLFSHPTSPITSLAFLKNTGVFYATDSGVGFVGSRDRFEFLKMPKTQILLRAGSLYVLLKESLGVFRIEDLAKFNTR